MAILTFSEIIDAALMTVILGFIFKDVFRRPRQVDYDPLSDPAYNSRFDFSNLKYAMIVTAPAIIFHELGHKFVAMAYGFTATFHASYFGLILGVILKLVGSPIVFFVPAYVSYPGGAAPLVSALIAFAGPFVNLILWLGSAFIMKKSRLRSSSKMLLAITSRINMFLFIFNMIPIPGFDGYHLFTSLWRAFF